MRIALYGNVCNNMYAIAKALRNYSSYDVHLYLPANADFNNLPENDDPALKDNYPDWIHKSKIYNLGSVFLFWKDNILKELRTYDLVILSSLSVSLSPYLGKCKTVFYATGGDLTVLPFKDVHRTLLYSGKRSNIKPIIYQWAQRRGISTVGKIITQPFYPFANSLKKLKIGGTKVTNTYFPIIIDTDNFKYRASAYDHVAISIQNEFDKFSFRIFHPSRVVVNNHPHMMETGQCKKNDLLLKAFSAFIHENRIKDAGLYLIERSYGHDREIVNFKKLIKELDIEQYVIWLKPDNNKGYTRSELANLYSLSDIVADDYGAGWFGSVCVEGFSCSKPVLSYVDENAMSQIYTWHPFLSSNTVVGNANYIKMCYFDKEYSKSQGALGRKWALEYHSPENAGKLYVREFEKMIFHEV